MSVEFLYSLTDPNALTKLIEEGGKRGLEADKQLSPMAGPLCREYSQLNEITIYAEFSEQARGHKGSSGDLIIHFIFCKQLSPSVRM